MLYYIHNTSRSVENRAQRYVRASHRGLLQFIDGCRVLRGRPLVVNEDFFVRNLSAITKAVEAGSISVKTPDGREIDLASGEPKVRAASTPLPNFLPDSIANDLPSGIAMPLYPGGNAFMAAVAAEPESGEDEEEVEAEHYESSQVRQQSGRKRGRK